MQCDGNGTGKRTTVVTTKALYTSCSLAKEGHISVKILRINTLLEVDLYYMMVDPSVKFE